jgi:hypothetical protein
MIRKKMITWYVLFGSKAKCEEQFHFLQLAEGLEVLKGLETRDLCINYVYEFKTNVDEFTYVKLYTSAMIFVVFTVFNFINVHYVNNVFDISIVNSYSSFVLTNASDFITCKFFGGLV